MFRISVIKSSSRAFQAACPFTSANFANAGIDLSFLMKSNKVKFSDVNKDVSRTLLGYQDIFSLQFQFGRPKTLWFRPLSAIGIAY